MIDNSRRIVITGMGVISPIGNSPDALWQNLATGRSGVDYLQRIPSDHLPSAVGGEAREFRGSIEDFGPLEKPLQRTIKKWMKLMCREIEMGVASAQLALADAGLSRDSYSPDRIGTMFGSDYIITEPEEFNQGIMHCIREGAFDFEMWGEHGLTQIEPLWLLKYLPNMPASHVAIYNDLRGPSNSLTVREASANLAISEATTILGRGIADVMVVGATGSRIHPLRSVHVALQEHLACPTNGQAWAPSQWSRPFDADRNGMVMGEGAGTLVLEDLDHAKGRGARIWGEVIGYGSSTVADQNYVANYRLAIRNVIQSALETGGITPSEIGHVNAHGLGSIRSDQQEAHAICDLLGERVPVVAVKSNMGNLGAGSGIVEVVASLKALQHDSLFPTLNYETPDPACPINVVSDPLTKPGDVFINLNITPQGQASAVVIRRSA